MERNPEKYFETKNAEGNAVLCPVSEVDKKRALAGAVDDENCFEKDVAGRYAANIEVERKF